MLSEIGRVHIEAFYLTDSKGYLYNHSLLFQFDINKLNDLFSTGFVFDDLAQLMF